jgi:hypothetical protein
MNPIEPLPWLNVLEALATGAKTVTLLREGRRPSEYVEDLLVAQGLNPAGRQDFYYALEEWLARWTPESPQPFSRSYAVIDICGAFPNDAAASLILRFVDANVGAQSQRLSVPSYYEGIDIMFEALQYLKGVFPFKVLRDYRYPTYIRALRSIGPQESILCRMHTLARLVALGEMNETDAEIQAGLANRSTEELALYRRFLGADHSQNLIPGGTTVLDEARATSDAGETLRSEIRQRRQAAEGKR